MTVCAFTQELQSSVDNKEKDILKMLLIHQISHRHCKQVMECRHEVGSTCH